MDKRAGKINCLLLLFITSINAKVPCGFPAHLSYCHKKRGRIPAASFRINFRASYLPITTLLVCMVEPV